MKGRVIANLRNVISDVYALPAAIVRTRLVRRLIPLCRRIPDTLIFQRLTTRGILVGNEVAVDMERARSQGIDVAVQPRVGPGGPRPAGTTSLEALMDKSSEELKAVDSPSEATAALIYTSGTTGHPKGVMLSHRNFLAECRLTEEIIPAREDDRFASLVPFFHIYGLATALVVPIFRGCSAVLIPQYAPKRFVTRMVEDRITVIMAIPAQYHHLLLAARRAGTVPHTLRCCVSGAAPLPPKIIEAFGQTFGVTIMEGYGLSETTAAVAVNREELTKPGSVGVPLEGVEVKIIDEQGESLPAYAQGEIVVKGEIVMEGYHNLTDDTTAVLKEGWLYTGDIGYTDEDGYLFITDRKKDLIIKGGYNISPAEIENVICRHPLVREVAVVGCKEKEGREESVKAFIVPVEGREVPAREIIGFCCEHLVPYKVPDTVEFRTELPKSATGKVLKKVLRPDYKHMGITKNQ